MKRSVARNLYVFILLAMMAGAACRSETVPERPSGNAPTPSSPASLVILRAGYVGATDRVGCASGALSPDGKPDIVFELAIQLPPTSAKAVIKKIEIEREGPPIGVWQSQGPSFVLGVADSSEGTPAAPSPEGLRAELIGGIEKRYWLFACHDVPELTNASYIVRLYLEDGSILQSGKLTGLTPKRP